MEHLLPVDSDGPELISLLAGCEDPALPPRSLGQAFNGTQQGCMEYVDEFFVVVP